MPDAPLDPAADPALALVHEGWAHLKRQRPLAAWACWQRALRHEPGHEAATRALDVLANAPDLPAAARVEYRFLTPTSDPQRRRWDDELRSRDLADLAVAAAAFGRLAGPVAGAEGDGRARFNQGLCLAWAGANRAAIEALAAAVEALAEPEPGVAADAWLLAEVLRQGAGAEELADDLGHAATVAYDADRLAPGDPLEAAANARAVPVPTDPATGRPTRPDVSLFEWLDRPAAAPGDEPRLVLATAIRSAQSLRLSGPDPALLERAVAEVLGRLGPAAGAIRREATPLPLAFLDAAVWAIRLPAGLDPAAADAANRAHVERHYESTWINRPRRGLDGRTPVEAGQLAARGDAAARARLVAVIRLREQLGARPSTLRLYQGYPFDRLRRRVGLPPDNPEAVDPLDVATMGPADLDALDPKSLDDFALVDAFESAAALGDDARTARFAAWLADLDPDTSAPALARVDRPALFAVLVRQALAEDDVDLALEWTDRAAQVDATVAAGRSAAQFLTWRAEILARTGQPEAALAAYRTVLDRNPSPLAALDAAETLLDNGHDDHARTLARIARDRATQAGDAPLADRAEALL